MSTIEPELHCPAPRPARLRAGARLGFVTTLSLFLLIGGLPVVHVVRQVWAFQALQRDGRPVQGVVRRRSDPVLIPGLRAYALQCVYANASGKNETATLAVPRGWWLASPPGSRVTITTCDAAPGHALLGDPSEMQLSEALGLEGSGMLILGLAALLLFGSCLRRYFHDMALVSLGVPMPGRVVGRTSKVVRRWGFKVTLWMVHLQFQDPFGVERVRTQIVDARTWARVAEGECMTVLACARRRGWFAAYSLLIAEASPSRHLPALSMGPKRRA